MNQDHSNYSDLRKTLSDLREDSKASLGGGMKQPMRNAGNKVFKDTNEALLQEAINIELCRRSMYHFFKEMWRIIEPHTDYSDNWHIRFLCELLQVEVERVNANIPKYTKYTIEKDGFLFFPKGTVWEGKDLVINLPFRSTKSLITSVCLPVWAWIVNPAFRFITASWKDALATKSAVVSRQLIQSSFFQKCCDGKVTLSLDQNEKDRYVNTEAGSRLSLSILGGGATGEGCNFLIVDDPISPAQAASSKLVDKVNQVYKDTFYSRVNTPKIDLRLIIMQRVSANDLSGKWKDNETVRHINMPAYLSDESIAKLVKPHYLKKFYSNGYFWADRWDKAQLNAYESAQGEEVFMSQLQQAPEKVAGRNNTVSINPTWWKYYDNTEVDFTSAVWNFVIDGAFTENKEKNDPTGILCYTYMDGRWYIKAAESVYMTPLDLVNHIERFAMRNGYSSNSYIGIEPKGSGQAILPALKSMKPFLNTIYMPSPVTDKITRFKSARPAIEAGRFYLHIGDVWVDNFIDQCKRFPSASHDEYPDLVSMIFLRHQSDFEAEGGWYLDINDGDTINDNDANSELDYTTDIGDIGAARGRYRGRYEWSLQEYNRYNDALIKEDDFSLM